MRTPEIERWSPGGPGGGQIFPCGLLGGDVVVYHSVPCRTGYTVEELCAACASRVPGRELRGFTELLEGGPVECAACHLNCYPAYGPLTGFDGVETVLALQEDDRALEWRICRANEAILMGKDHAGKELTQKQIQHLTERVEKLKSRRQHLRREFRELTERFAPELKAWSEGE